MTESEWLNADHPFPLWAFLAIVFGSNLAAGGGDLT